MLRQVIVPFIHGGDSLVRPSRVFVQLGGVSEACIGKKVVVPSKKTGLSVFNREPEK